jgi:DnaJ-class molecular chaperone
MRDPYDVLGVRRGDTDETLRNAYRKLAKRHHPDLNAGKPEAAERFKEINAAYDILSDPARRARFDRGEIDAQGNEAPPRPSWRDSEAAARAAAAAGGGRGAGFGASGFGGGGGQPFDMENLEAILGAAFTGRGGAGPAAGTDARYSLTVDFLDAANGAVRRLTLPDGRTLDVTIPAGLRDGHVLRLRGQGQPGRGGAPAGDALVEVTVASHPFFRREGDDVILSLPVTLQEAVLGAGIEVPTIRGPVRLSIPPNSANGSRLRLKGRGISGGHQFVELVVTLPPEPEPALDEFLRSWKPARPFDPRAALRAEIPE